MRKMQNEWMNMLNEVSLIINPLKHPHTLAGRPNQPAIQNLSKSVAGPTARDGRTNTNAELDGTMHENLTDAKIHRLTEVLIKV